MEATTLSNLKRKYKEFLMTEQGHTLLAKAVAIKREWMERSLRSDVTLTTSGVKTKFINAELTTKIKKIEILPIGLNNMCHITSEYLCGEGITSRLGFNVTACPCGRMMSYELHSVNKMNGQLYDFTKDFNDETHKYFLELDTDMTSKTYINIYGKDPITINRGCRCKIVWNSMREYQIPESEFRLHIRQVENDNITVW